MPLPSPVRLCSKFLDYMLNSTFTQTGNCLLRQSLGKSVFFSVLFDMFFLTKEIILNLTLSLSCVLGIPAGIFESRV